MGICSYCYAYSREECFGWDEARVCGITGSNDPQRLRKKIDYNLREAQRLKGEAAKILGDAKARAASLKERAKWCEAEAKSDRRALSPKEQKGE